MKIHRGVAAVLKQAGATLIRHSKHYIFQLPNGKKLTVSSTPSDTYAVNNQMREIKQAGGLTEEKRRNPERVEKQGRTDANGRRVTREWLATDTQTVPRATPLAQQLSASGIAERALRQQVQDLQSRIEHQNFQIDAQQRLVDDVIVLMENFKCPCFICRIRRYLHV